MNNYHEKRQGTELSSSDQDLLNLLNEACLKRSALRLFRIAGPKGFRKAIVLSSDSDLDMNDPFVSKLLSSDIPLLKILLADPHGEAFLRRLDQEQADSWKIWRVRKQLFMLVNSMLNIAKLRRNPESLKVGFHREELIWNLGIVGENDVLVRPYGEKGTGHDNSQVGHRIKNSNDDNLAGAFYKYFEAVSKHHDTKWASTNSVDLTGKPHWPSLYKGNAILSTECKNNTETEPLLKPNEICKICIDSRANEAEEKWLGIPEHIRFNQNSFKPGKIIKGIDDFRGQGIIVERISGPSLFELTTLLDKYSNNEKSESNHSILINMILEDSINALLEFREIAKKVLPRIRRTSYPYAAKLISSIKEIQRHYSIIQNEIWKEAIEDASELGDELEQNTQEPFRDAHLKNRLWQEKLTTDTIAKKLLDLSIIKAEKIIKKKIRDIDFETSFYDVTKWDDPIHILLFDHLADKQQTINPFRFEIWKKYEKDLGSLSDLRMWRTGLARATREFARRLWYKNVMPNTYSKRYSLEKPDFFLRLAIECSSRSSGYLKLRRLLEALEAHTTTSDSINSSKFDIKILNKSAPHNKALRVFISYSHHDEEHRKNLEKSLKLLQRSGLIEFWNDRKLLAGDDFDNQIKSELNISDIVIFLVSLEFLASDYIDSLEVSTALKLHKEGQIVVVPIIVRPSPFKEADFSHLLALPKDGKAITTWNDEDIAWLDVHEGLRKLCLQMREKK